MLKKIMYLPVIACLVFMSIYAYAVFKNNQHIEAVPSQRLQLHLQKAVSWLLANKEVILSQDNPVLWWMLQESGRLSGNKELYALVVEYHQKYPYINTGVWGVLFEGRPQSYLDESSVLHMPYYNKHMIYALNCAYGLASEVPEIEQQNNADFCFQRRYFYRPACVTHQLMSVNFLEQKNCGFVKDLPALKSSLQKSAANQLTWDVRVVDVYLQRVLMLYLTGAADMVKPVWVKNILDHQHSDGSWGDFVELLKLGDISYGFSAKGISSGKPEGLFHATAQGVYLLTYLLAQEDTLVTGQL